MDVEQIAEGLWRWTTPHPEWSPAADWPEEVGCVYLETADAVVLVDPLVPADGADRERFLTALDRDLARAGRTPELVLTVFWHERSAQELLDRFDGAALWAPEPALEQLSAKVTNPFRPGDVLPAGLQALEVDRRGEVLLWSSEHRALVAGDVLLGDSGGMRVCPDDWLPEGVTPAELRTSLRPLLELPVERVLVSHGEPVLQGGREALARALGRQQAS